MNKYKKIFCVLLSSFVLFSMFFGCSKKDENEVRFITGDYNSGEVTESALTETTTEKSKYNLINNDAITVAVNPSNTSLIDKNNDEFYGFDIEFITCIASNLGKKVKFVEVNSSDIIYAIDTGVADIAIGGIRDEQNQMSSYLSEPYVKSFIRWEGTDASIENERYVIAVGRNTNLINDINEQIKKLSDNKTIDSLASKYDIGKNIDKSIALPAYTDTKGKQIHINSISEIKLAANKTNQELILTNNANNPCFLKFMIYIDSNRNGEQDDSDNLIIETQMVPPGYSVSEVELKKNLSAGDYNGLVMVHTYSYDKKQRPLNKQLIRTTITVE